MVFRIKQDVWKNKLSLQYQCHVMAVRCLSITDVLHVTGDGSFFYAIYATRFMTTHADRVMQSHSCSAATDAGDCGNDVIQLDKIMACMSVTRLLCALPGRQRYALPSIHLSRPGL